MIEQVIVKDFYSILIDTNATDRLVELVRTDILTADEARLVLFNLVRPKFEGVRPGATSTNEGRA